MATEYKGVPIGSLPEATSLNSSDELIAYRGGQAYRSDVGHLGETANGNISDAFSTSVSYAVGDYCIYNDTLYKCTTAHDKASWNSSHFEAVTVGEELSELNTNQNEWIEGEVTAGSGITLNAKVHRIGNIGYINLNTTAVSTSPAQGNTIATIPEQFCPEEDVRLLGALNVNGSIGPAQFIIHTDGRITQEWTNQTVSAVYLCDTYLI